MLKGFKKIVLSVTLILFSGLLFAQENGIVKGVIKDSQTGDLLPGTNIIIKEINYGTTSNLDGEYYLNNVPVGASLLTISYLGYEVKEIKVELATKEIKVLDIELKPLSIEVGTVTVTAQVRGQRAAINQQLSSNTIKNVVSSEKIKELPEANAAEAIGRLPGVSLQRSAGEANKIVVRGLSPKYNSVTVEGIKLGSTSQDRSVDLSMIQSEQLDGIEVSKSLRPDQDADALGGTINLRLGKAPKERKMLFVAEGGYTSLGSSFDNYKFTGGFSDRFFKDKLGLSAKVTHENKYMPSHKVEAKYTEPVWSPLLDDEGNDIGEELIIRTKNASLIERQQTRMRTNGSLILDYETEWWDIKFYNMISQKNDLAINRNNKYIFFIEGSDPESFKLDLQEDDWRTLSRIHSIQNEFRFGRSKLFVVVSTSYAEENLDQHKFNFGERNPKNLDQNWLIYRDPAEAMDAIGGADSLKVEDTYLQMFNIADRKLTDESYDAKIDYELSYTISDAIKGKLKIGGKYHQLTRKSAGDAYYSDFRYGEGFDKQQHLYGLFPWVELDLANASEGIPAYNFVDENYNPGEFLNGRWDLGWSGDIDLLTSMQDEYLVGDPSTNPNYYLNGEESYKRDYEASEELMAGYLMTEINIGKKLMLLPGVRYENNKTEYLAYHIITDSNKEGIEKDPDQLTTNRENSNWFPSVNFKYKFTEAIALQGASYKSISRPSFIQISPLAVYKHRKNEIISYNPWLNPSTAWNFDLGISYSKPKVGLITVYGFYKSIDNLIYDFKKYSPNLKKEIVGAPDEFVDNLLDTTYFDPNRANWRTDFPVNSPEKASVAGLELSWQTSFWYLPGLLKGLVLDVNYTIINTRTKYPHFNEVIVGYDSSLFTLPPIYEQQYGLRSGKMVDQPASILNVIVGWDYKGFSSRISYRYQSKTLEGLDARYSSLDNYYSSFSLIDLMLKQKINKHISVYMNVKNIGNHFDEYYTDKQTKWPQMLRKEEYYGMRVQFGARIKI